LEDCWSSKRQLWKVFGVQSVSFGKFLEFKALALESFWSSKRQLWVFFEINEKKGVELLKQVQNLNSCQKNVVYPKISRFV